MTICYHCDLRKNFMQYAYKTTKRNRICNLYVVLHRLLTMDSAEFRKIGYQMIDLVADYMENIRKRDPLPAVAPGYLRKILPKDAPEKGESWTNIIKDIEPVVLEGMCHWGHPNFHAYFPSANSWPSILGGVMSNAFANSCGTWEQSPVGTELEIIVCDWIAKFLGLPTFFLSKFSNPESEGGGAIQGSASDTILISMLAAREHTIKKLRDTKFKKTPRGILLSKLVAYCSSQCHSCVEKAAMISMVKLRLLEPDETGALRPDTLSNAINEDKHEGLVPFFHCCIFGSTGTCAFDDLMELGPICQAHEVWLHVDGAYAGNALICPEMRYLSQGMEFAWSFNLNANKWLLTNFDAAIHWFRYRNLLTDCLSGNNYSLHNKQIVDYQYTCLTETRRFRAMKLWCVIRNYGIKGIQNYIRRHIYLAKLFEKHVKRDDRFEVIVPATVGLCCYRLKGINDLNKRFLEALNFSRKIHMVPSSFLDKYVIRFVLCNEHANESDVEFAWKISDQYASALLRHLEKESVDIRTLQPLFEQQREYEEQKKRRVSFGEALPTDVKHEQEALQVVKRSEFRRQSRVSEPLLDLTSKVDDWISGADEKGFHEYDQMLSTNSDFLNAPKRLSWPSKGRKQYGRSASISVSNMNQEEVTGNEASSIK